MYSGPSKQFLMRYLCLDFNCSVPQKWGLKYCHKELRLSVCRPHQVCQATKMKRKSHTVLHYIFTNVANIQDLNFQKAIFKCVN